MSSPREQMNTITSLPEHVEIISPLREQPFAPEWYNLNSQNHFWFCWRLVVLRRLLTSMNIDLTSPAHVLDVGCGIGTLRDQMEGITTWTIDGVDLDIRALARTPRGRGRLFFYDIQQPLPQFTESHDYVFLFDVLEHITNTQLFLQCVLRPLRPGGVLFVNVPAMEWLRSEYDNTIGHLRRYTAATLCQEFNGYPARIEEVRYWGFSLVPILLLRKAMTKRKKDRGQIIRDGMKPPYQWINNALAVLGKIESTWLQHPPIGTSVLLAIRKTG